MPHSEAGRALNLGWMLLCAWAEPQGLDPHDRGVQQEYRDYVATYCECSSSTMGFPVHREGCPVAPPSATP